MQANLGIEQYIFRLQFATELYDSVTDALLSYAER